MKVIAVALTVTATILGGVSCAQQNPAHSSRPAPRNVLDVAAIPADSGLVLVRGDRLDVLFPVSPIGPGCSRPKDLQGPTAQFHWTIRYSEPTEPYLIELRRDPQKRALADLRTERALFMQTGIDVSVPASPVISEARLDSAFTRRAVGVWTGTWVRDGAGPESLTEPELRAVYFDQGRLHFVLKGKGVMNAFLSLKPDTVTLTWCGPSGYDRQLTVAVTRG